jgi:zinc transporter, ZIP family
MSAAFFWGLLAGSSLVLGGLAALFLRIGTRVLGTVMAFGAGVLISAVAYELVAEAFRKTGGVGGAAVSGLFTGSIVFFVGDALLDRLGAADRKRSSGEQSAGSPLAIVLGIVLDGVPESIVLGLTLVGGGGVSVAMLVAVFLSNLPEAIAATTGLDRSGWSQKRVLLLWLVVALVTALSSLAGFALFDEASDDTVAFVLAFAAGAILTMLADTMMPEAFEHGGKLVGLITTLGFALAFAISTLE